jgi:hypothetical protein
MANPEVTAQNDKKPNTAEPVNKTWREYLIVLIAAGLLYTATCAPAILWQDSALFVYRILHGELTTKLGLAIAHPLYILLGMLVREIPVGDLAHRVNLMSAVFGAVTVANVYVLAAYWLGRRFPAVVAAMTLAVSWTFWQHSAIAECYTLYAAIFTAELMVLLRYLRTSRTAWLYLLALLNGLSVANHLFGVLPLACYAVLLGVLMYQGKVKAGQALLMAALWVLGALPYEYLIVREMIATGDVSGTLASALYGKYTWKPSVLNVSLSARMAMENLVFIGLNFPTLNIVFFFIGVWAMWRVLPRSFAAVVFAVMALFFVFAFRYTVPDRHAFFFPFYILAALCIGAGVHHFRMRWDSGPVRAAILCFALLPAAVYCFTPAIGRHYYKSLAQRRQVPYRDDYTYWLQPWKTGYTGGERFATEALIQVEKDSVIYADATTVHAILYIQEYRKLRPDVSVVSSVPERSCNAKELSERTIDGLLAQSAVYVVSPLVTYCPRFILDRYETVREGVLYRVVSRQGG